MFRILTAVLIVVSGIFFLTDTQRFSAEGTIERLDDKVVLELLYKKRKALARFELERAKNMYSKSIVVEVVTPDGEIYRSGHKELIGLIDDYGRTGRGHEKTLLNHAVMVADDGLSAVVRKEALESWMFEDEFRTVSGNLIETQHWVLENGIPKITGIKKEQSISDPFFLQRREKQQLSDDLRG